MIWFEEVRLRSRLAALWEKVRIMLGPLLIAIASLMALGVDITGGWKAALESSKGDGMSTELISRPRGPSGDEAIEVFVIGLAVENEGVGAGLIADAAAKANGIDVTVSWGVDWTG